MGINEQQFDLVVVGGGPAGMMCAGRAAERGANVLLLEKNSGLGVKLALTGGGRCNLTNALPDVRQLVTAYGAGGKALFSAFSRFGVPETIDFFGRHGLETKTEAENRVFPVTDDSRDVIRVLADYMKKGKVSIILNAAVIKVIVHGNKVRVLTNDCEFQSKSIAIATGGRAYPETGSTGEGLNWLAQLGHKIFEPDVSLVPIKTKEQWVAELSGLSFSDVKATVFENGKRVGTKKGKLLFTHFGLSGPLILNMSKGIGESLSRGEVIISIDINSGKNSVVINKEILALFAANQNKKIKNVVEQMFPAKIGMIALGVCNIDPEKFVNLVNREERNALVKFAKDMRLTVNGLMGLDKAVASSGGVDVSEVDFKTMRSRIHPNLYILGDALNFNRPSGGFSLQICWTTGYLAGDSVDIKK